MPRAVRFERSGSLVGRSRSIALGLALLVTVACGRGPARETASAPGDGSGHAALARQFLDPPLETAPLTLWHWMNGNVSEAGITADLEAMAAIGLGGAIVFSVEEHTPPGEVPFASPAFYQHAASAIEEAHRLGLEIGFHVSDGWSASGGPWITPELSMKMLTASAERVRGPARYDDLLPQPPERAGLYGDIATFALPLGESTADARDIIAPRGRRREPPFYRKAFFPIPSPLTMPDNGGHTVTPVDGVVDLTEALDDAGRLAWDVPPGDWVIVRIGYTTTGQRVRAATRAGGGLECDKLDPETVELHFDRYLGRLLEAAERHGDAAGIDISMLDSFEAAQQNWTDGLLEIFRQMNGYDVTPYLPGLFGFTVESDEVMEKVYYDWRRTIARRMATAYFGRLAELSREQDLRLYLEPYGPGSYNYIDVGRHADRPMGEFWVDFRTITTVATSTGHTYGKPVIAAEAFTQGHWNQRLDAWQAHPALLAPIGDRAWALGINELVFHRFVHQPNPYARPGLGMGRWGMHMDRTQTWWESAGRAWVESIRRGQLLLRQGVHVADLLRFAGDAVPIHIPQPEPSPYKEDVANRDVLLTRVTVEGGRITLPDGATYGLLTLDGPSVDDPGIDDPRAMLPETLRRIHRLVEAGMALHGPPPSGSPSFAAANAWTAVEEALIEDLWGPEPRAGRGTRRFGEGTVLWGMEPAEALRKLGVEPDLRSDSGRLDWLWTHRRDPRRDIYFVANPGSEPTVHELSFRVAAGAPELWYADSGRIEPVPIWRRKDERTVVPLALEPGRSVFVVFDRTVDPPTRLARIERLPDHRPLPNQLAGAVPDTARTSIESAGALRVSFWEEAALDLIDANGLSHRVAADTVPASLPLEGPWAVSFSTELGGPGSTTFERLIDWTRSDQDGIRFYSGTATYSRRFDWSPPPDRDERVVLDLGRVHDIAEVSVNGSPFETLWKPPFVIDVTDRLADGTNSLEVRVTNTWVNRLIGDERLYPERYESPVDPEWGTALSELPDWFRRGEQPPADGPVTFTSPRFHAASDELRPAGLVGPVVMRRIRVERIPSEGISVERVSPDASN